MLTRPAPRIARAAVAALALLWVTTCASADPGGAVVERRQVDLTLLADGSLQVREALTVRLFAEPVTEFRHDMPGARVDAFFDTATWIDGVPVDDDPADAERARVEHAPDLRVVFEFPPATDTVREFVFEYRAGGAMAAQGANVDLEWPVAPLRPPYPVVRTDVRLVAPPGAVFREAPYVYAEGDWAVELQPGGLTATREGIAPGEAATVVARIASDTMAAPRPDWQFNEALAAELVPAFVSGGLFMLVVGIGILWMVHAWYPDPRRHWRATGDAVATPAPAESLPPAYRVALRRRRLFGARAALRAAAVDLERRGVLAAGAAGGAALLAHEQVLANEAWLSGASGAAAGRLARARRPFLRALVTDMAGAGLVDAERVSVAQGLTVSGVAVVVMGAACAAVVPWLLWRYGVAAQAVPLGIVGLGLMLWVAGRRLVVLTPEGERRRAALG